LLQFNLDLPVLPDADPNVAMTGNAETGSVVCKCDLRVTFLCFR
jgi:hypothetical protein